MIPWAESGRGSAPPRCPPRAGASCSSTPPSPRSAASWTDDGRVHETRDLKGRAEGDAWRDGLQPGDLFFPGEKGGLLAGSVFRRAWSKAGKAVLPEYEYESPVGKRLYDLRHTCLATWLNHGIPPVQVAEWAGNSVSVLLATYARCITAQLAELQQCIEGPRRLPAGPSPRMPVPTRGSTLAPRRRA